MPIRVLRLLSILAVAPFSLPAIADDCTPAWIASAQHPASAVVTKIDAHGTETTGKSVQTLTTQYLQTPDGAWTAINSGIKDNLDGLKTTKVSCERVGSETINGVPSTVYTVHVNSDGNVVDGKAWISANSLIQKSDLDIQARHYVTVYDYTHVSPPANAKPK
jgi:hypothetical protein